MATREKQEELVKILRDKYAEALKDFRKEEAKDERSRMKYYYEGRKQALSLAHNMTVILLNLNDEIL